MDPTPLAEAEALQALFTALQQTHVVHYALVGALTVLVHDTIANMNHEINYIWRSSWSLPKVLYLICRYYAPLHTITMIGLELRTDLNDTECKAWIWIYSTAGLVVLTTTIDIILVMRLYALYKQNKKVLIFLIVITTLQFLLEMTTSVIASATAKSVPAPPVPWPGCLVAGITSLTLISWVPNICVAFLYAVMLFYGSFVSSGIDWRSRNLSGISPLVQTFIFDGAFFFVITFVTVLVSAVTTVTVHNPLAVLMEPWLIVSYSLSGTRLIINLRITAEDPRSMQSQEDTTMIVSKSLPRFARNAKLQESYELSDMSFSSRDQTSMQLERLH